MDLLLKHKNEVELFTNYCKISTKDDYSSWDLDNPPTRTGFPKTQLSNVFPLIESMTNIDDDSNTSGTLLVIWLIFPVFIIILSLIWIPYINNT